MMSLMPVICWNTISMMPIISGLYTPGSFRSNKWKLDPCRWTEKPPHHLRWNPERTFPWSCGLTCSSHASSMRAHSHSMGASGPRRNRSASSASRRFPFDSRKRGVSGMKHIRTMSRVGGMEQQRASQRQLMKRPAGGVHTNHNPSHIPSVILRPFLLPLASQ